MLARTAPAIAALNDDPQESYVRHPVLFTGQGAEYRRIWGVNALLTLLTLGLYYPWTMVGKFKYFYTHTFVAGHALDYHASAKQIFFGNLLGTVLINGLFFGISKLGPYADTAHTALQLLFAALVPVILHGFMQFQLTHTSWRGQRFALHATPADAYRAMGLPTAIYVLSSILITAALDAGRQGLMTQAAGLGAAGVLALCIGLPMLYVRYRHYQHRYAAYGELRNEQAVDARALPKACLRSILMAIVLVFGLALPLAIWLAQQTGFDLRQMGQMSLSGPGSHIALATALFVGPLFFILTGLLMALPYPYLGAHLQNSMWADTAHRRLRFESQVPVEALLKLTIKDWFLIVGTLGFYYPYAAVAEAKLRLHAMAIHLHASVLTPADPPGAQTPALASDTAEHLQPKFSV